MNSALPLKELGPMEPLQDLASIKEPPISPLRVGLLVDEPSASKYVLDFVIWAQANQNIVSVTHLIVHAPGPVPHTDVGSFRRLLTRMKRDGVRAAVVHSLVSLSYKFLVRSEQLLLRRNGRHANHLEKFDLSRLVPNAIRILPKVSKSGFVYRFSLAEVEKVKKLELDLLLRCGSGILRGEILEAARLGIISFHHADNRINRGGPPGFWEVYNRQGTTGFTIQQLTEELDGGNVLMRGHFATQSYYLLNQAALFEKSNYYLKLLVKKIACLGVLPEALGNTPYSKALFRLPRLNHAVLYLLKTGYYLIVKAIRKTFHIEYRWNVAYTRCDWRNAVLLRGRKLKALPFHFLADPFIATKDGRDFCFVEDYDYLKRRGSIVVYELSIDGDVRAGTALEESFHLSFPFLFEYNGEIYMSPETAEKREIRIYKSMEFPLKWKLEKVAMSNVSAADTMFFKQDGKWWMFTNIDSTETGDYCCELSIFSSDSPFGVWRPHALNPVIVDAGRARNGGLIGREGNFFRVSQAQGFDKYGKSCSINKICQLTDSNYEESCVAEITPTFNVDVVGAHHMHSNGSITVFDFATFSRVKQ
jgi:hypothetical protein